MQVRSFDKPFELVDYTEELNLIPNEWGLVNSLGIFSKESVSQHSITVESTSGTLALITDQVRGAKNLVSKDTLRNLRSFPIPHFPLDDYITPQDVQGKRAYGSPDAADTKDAVVARKLAQLRKNHAVTLEAARCFALTNGAIYAPNATVAANYFTDFGVSQKTIDFVLGTTTTEVNEKIEEGIAHIQDNILSGQVVTNIVVLCSPAFFAKLIKHATMKEAYKYYSSTQELLRTRLGGNGLFRRFEHGGVTFIEYRGSYNGTPLIPVGDAIMIPQGTEDMFISYFSPANKFSHVNTLGEEAYAFSYTDPSDEKITLQTESNQLHLIRRPACVVRCFSSN
jgi:Phage major capsid protein E